MDAQTWMVVIVGALFGLVGIIYAFLRTTATKTETKLDEVVDDIADVKQRLTKVETKVERIESEVDSLRKRFHDLYDYTLRGVGTLLQDFKSEVMRLLGK